MLFGIVQGGLFKDLRAKSADLLTSLDMPGYSIGGLSVGESKKEMYDMVEATTSFLPVNKPRYLMGVGSPEDLVECVYRGVDMFDCVLPTRVARNGALFSYYGRVNITGLKYKFIDEPFDKSMNLQPWQFLVITQLIIFLLGWPLEWTEILIIFVPIFLPLVEFFGVNPYFFYLNF